MNAPPILSRDRTPSLFATFDRYVAASLIALMTVTHRLWLVRDLDFPSVPSTTLPIALSNTAMTGISIGLLIVAAIIVAGYLKRAGWLLIATGLGTLFLADQAHLQPWAYLIFCFSILFAVCGPDHRTLPRWIAISVYFWSGLGKLDFQFLHTVGQDFLSPLTFHATDGLSVSARASLALAMPVGEMIIAIGLAIPHTRRIACVLAMLLHTTLILILGPWSLDHSLGVLVWNAVLIGQAFFLFWQREESSAENSAPTIAWIVAAVIIVGPILERRGQWDHWLAWSLYAPHTSRADAQIANAVAERLPSSIQEHLKPIPDDLLWQSLDLSSWSLSQRGVPIYPQGRYQARLMELLSEQHGIDDGVDWQRRGVSDRWTGKRSTTKKPGRW